MNRAKLTFAGPMGRVDKALATDAIVNQLGLAPVVIDELLGEMSDERIRTRPEPGKWSAQEHACHLVAVDALFFARLDSMLARDNPDVVPYVPPPEDEEGALLKRDLRSDLARFRTGRDTLVRRLRELVPGDWNKTARHPDYNEYNIRIMFRHAMLHDMLHCYRIEELALKRDWT